MQKKIIAFVLLASILLSCSIGVNASVPYTEDFARELVRELEIMVGDSVGNMNLDAGLTRAEFTTIAVSASKYKNSVAHGAKISVFKDCNYKHWAAPYVKVAVTNGIITGYPDGTFRPDNSVTYEEAFVVALKLLGYTDQDFGNTWPYGQVSLGKSIGLGDNISKGIGDYITRGEALILMYNTLNAKVKGSNSEYISQLDATLYENVIIIATNAEDTSVAPGSVLTSAGTYKYDGYFDPFYVGTKGDLAVKGNGSIICYVPYEQKNSKYVVYSILDGSVIFYKDGNLTELDISNSTTVYTGAEKSTFSSSKSQLQTGDVVYVVKNTSGEVEYLKLLKDSLRGPETLTSYSNSWYTAYTDDLSSLNVMRNGEKVSYTEVKVNDVLYYLKDLNTIFAYSNTRTGIYEKATPNKDTPSSVVVSGVEYQLESVNAFNKLSSSGDLSYGASVTLLLGKDGKVADAVLAESTTGEEVVGYLKTYGKKVFENADGNSYSSAYITLILPDGSSVEYTTLDNCKEFVNSVVRITFKDENAKVTKYHNYASLSGTFDFSSMTIGALKLSKDIKILDVSTTRPDINSATTSIYPSRLDDLTFKGDMVLWYGKNESGEIDRLILNNVTGDTYKYGLVTSSSSDSQVTYTFDLAGGTSYKYSGGRISSVRSMTPVGAVVPDSGSSVETFTELLAHVNKVTFIGDDIIEIGNYEYKLYDKAVAYIKRSVGNYTLVPISDLAENLDAYTVKAYYDKKESNGGRIRVLIATPKK